MSARQKGYVYVNRGSRHRKCIIEGAPRMANVTAVHRITDGAKVRKWNWINTTAAPYENVEKNTAIALNAETSYAVRSRDHVGRLSR